MYSIKRTPEFDDWLAGIKDGMTRIRLAKRLDKVQRGLLGSGCLRCARSSAPAD